MAKPELAKTCHRSHPHELMTPECERFTEYERRLADDHAFLAEFDSYVAARVQLKQSPEGSDEERLAINSCADQWVRLLSARASLSATEGSI